jgi:ankyrin repeat protein
MTWIARLTAAIAIAAMTTPAMAQRATDGESFVSAVRAGDNNKALALLQTTPVIIDAIDSRGETALLAAVKNRDSAWAGQLLRDGADPNIAARNGDTPLIAAARVGFAEAAGWLLGVGAKVDAANRMGETALIVAVQEKHAPLVRLLLRAGADPDRTDAAAGFSARDYAKREPRFPELLAAIEANRKSDKPTAKTASEKLDDFKLN